MSSTSFPVSADSPLGSSGPECEPSRSARSIPTAGECSPGTGQMSLFSEMSENLPEKLLPTPSAVSYGSNRGGGMGRVGPVRHSLDAMARKGLWPTPTSVQGRGAESRLASRQARGRNTVPLYLNEAVSMSSAAASPARISPSPERARALAASAAAYGRNTPELLANYDPATSSWKTSQHCFLEGLETFSEIWPRSGMMRNGIAYALPTLAPLTGATGFGSSPSHSIPTPTPTAGDAKASGSRNTSSSKAHPGVSLTDFVKRDGGKGRTWPTPRATEWKGTGPLGSKSQAHRLGRGYLDATVQEVEQITGSLNPTWVEWLMGFPTGWTDLER